VIDKRGDGDNVSRALDGGDGDCANATEIVDRVQDGPDFAEPGEKAAGVRRERDCHAKKLGLKVIRGILLDVVGGIGSDGGMLDDLFKAAILGGAAGRWPWFFDAVMLFVAAVVTIVAFSLLR
jgi:hypothetical protein